MPGPVVNPEPVAEPIPAPVSPEQPMFTPVQEIPGAGQPQATQQFQGAGQPQAAQQYQAAPQPMAPGSIPAMAPVYGSMQGSPQPVPPTMPDAGKKKKGKAGIIIFFVIFLVLVLAGGVVFFLWMNRPAKKIASAFAAGDVNTAIELYEKVGNKNDLEDIMEQAESYARSLVIDYVKESKGADYRTVNDALLKLADSILYGNEEIENMIYEVNFYEDSRESFRTAEQYKQDGNYADAIKHYSWVTEDDSAYYALAEAAIEESSDLLREDAIIKANNYAAEGNYEEALNILDEAMSVLYEYDGELYDTAVQITNDHEEFIVEDALLSANEAIAQERHADALKILNEALESYPDNTDLIAAKNSLSSDGTIYGTWEMECDFVEMMGEDELLADLDEPLMFKILFNFNMDGTFRMYADEESITQVLHEYLTLYVYSMFEDSGYTKSEIDALLKDSAGVTIDEYVDMLMEESDSMTDIFDSLEADGIFEVEDDRLYMTDIGSYIDKEDGYDLYTVDGNILTISLPDGIYDEPVVEGISYPYSLTRVE